MRWVSGASGEREIKPSNCFGFGSLVKIMELSTRFGLQQLESVYFTYYSNHLSGFFKYITE